MLSEILTMKFNYREMDFISSQVYQTELAKRQPNPTTQNFQ